MTKEMTYDKWLFFGLCQNNHNIIIYVTVFRFVDSAPCVNGTWSFFVLFRADIPCTVNLTGFSQVNKEKRADYLNKLSDGYFDKETNMLYPIEPDIIGEFVFLWQFFDCIFEDKREKWLDYLSEKFGDEIDDYFTNFLIRCQANWKEKGTIFSSMINQRWEE